MAVRLTEAAISKAARDVAAAGARRDLSDAGCPGLRLRLTPAGGKAWVLACRDQLGRMRRFPIGEYPTLGIADARTAARLLHAKVKHEGADPVAERRRQRAIGGAAKEGVGTLKAVLDAYTNTAGAAPKSWAIARPRVELVFRRVLKSPVSTITAADLQMEADAYPRPKAGAFAVRCLRPALKWAAGRGYVAAALAEIVPRVAPERRARVLTRDELARVLPALKASVRPHALALRFMLLTLARREEVGAAEWRHVDLAAGTWTIPETKNGEPHTVPLSRQAVALLEEVKARPKPAKPSALVFHTRSGARLGNWDRETKAVHTASKTAGWTRHDLRRTGATALGEMGVLPDIIEAALNHASIRSPLAATYNRSRYRPQVAEALQRLADALDGIEAGAATVIPFRPPARA